MALPSFDPTFLDSRQQIKPRIYVLEIRERKTPDAAPIAWLLVERQEIFKYAANDGAIYEASIRLSYERIDSRPMPWSAGKGYFCGSYSCIQADKPMVSLTSETLSKGAVFLDLPKLQGHRIGTYLMNEIVTWVKQWPNAAVRPIELVSNQANDEENKIRRNRFYEQFGLTFDYHDPCQKAGLSKPILAKELNTVNAWQTNIREINIRDFIGTTLSDFESIERELSQKEMALTHQINYIRHIEAKPLRWVIRYLFAIHLPVLSLMIVVVLLGYGVWQEFFK